MLRYDTSVENRLKSQNSSGRRVSDHRIDLNPLISASRFGPLQYISLYAYQLADLHLHSRSSYKPWSIWGRGTAPKKGTLQNDLCVLPLDYAPTNAVPHRLFQSPPTGWDPSWTFGAILRNTTGKYRKRTWGKSRKEPTLAPPPSSK